MNHARHARLAWQVSSLLALIGCSESSSNGQALDGVGSSPTSSIDPASGSFTSTSMSSMVTGPASAPTTPNSDAVTPVPGSGPAGPTGPMSTEPAIPTSDVGSHPQEAPTSAAGGTLGSGSEPGQAGSDQGGAGGVDDAGVFEPEPPLDLPDGLLAVFPTPGGVELCADPTLMLRFSHSVRLAGSGAFIVRDADSGDAVARVDLGSTSTQVNVGGSNLRIPPPAFVVDDPQTGGESDLVVVSFAAGKLSYGGSFEVTFDGDPILGNDGQPALDPAELDWTFTTRATAPKGEALSVGLSRDADYCSIQGALDAASDGTTIEVSPGVYPGLMRLNGKDGITLRGVDREKTVLLGVNNESLNGGTRSRPLFLAESVSDLTIETLTIKNLTPQGGSQAEALALLSCDRCAVRDATIESLQDTLLWSGRIYAEQCLIVGNVDYIWGTGAVFFKECEIRTVGRKGYNLQARNDAGKYGYVFVDSKLTAEPGITGDILARIEVDRFPGSQVAYIDCEMGSHIAPEGWIITGGGASSQLRFWEYNSHSPSGDPIDTSRRAAGSRQLSASEAEPLRDPSVVLGGWSP